CDTTSTRTPLDTYRRSAGGAERLDGGEILVDRGKALDGDALAEQALVLGGAVLVAAEAALRVALSRVDFPASAAQVVLALVLDEADDVLVGVTEEEADLVGKRAAARHLALQVGAADAAVE